MKQKSVHGCCAATRGVTIQVAQRHKGAWPGKHCGKITGSGLMEATLRKQTKGRGHAHFIER